MPATTRSKAEPAKMTNVKNVVTVKAEVDKLFPRKYFAMSYHGPALFFAR